MLARALRGCLWLAPCLAIACARDFDALGNASGSAASGGLTSSNATSGVGGSTTTSGPSTSTATTSATSSASTSASVGSGGAGGSGGAVASAAVGSGGSGGAPPVCGNGIVEPGEACDDGNTLPADGCSATCTIENPDACPGPSIPLTTAGFTVQGNTTSASNDTGAAPCGGTVSGDFVYQITPMQSGTFSATLTGSFSTLLYARPSCPDSPSSDLACSTTHSPAQIQFAVTAGQSFSLFVDGYGTTPQEGPFTLTLSLQ